MKLKNLALLVIFFTVIGCGGSGNDDKKEKSESGKSESSSKKDTGKKPANAMFDIKAAKIVFTSTAGPETGTETLYFDDYGNRAVLIIDKKSKYSNNNQTMIWKDNQTTMINHETKVVSKSPFRPKATEPPALADTDEETRKSIGYEKLADETIAGKNCEVWFNAKQNFKYCLWKKVSLKTILGNSINDEATSVEEISEIPASVMEVPKDYTQ